jgi:hydrogenase expression/formation protein HypD
MASGEVHIDGFILPGHVSVIIGRESYRPFFEKYQIPCAITGFEPVDLLRGIDSLIRQIEFKRPELDNAYPRAVTAAGNRKATGIMEQVFENTDAGWRGMGTIPASGLKIREAFERFDARKVFDIKAAYSAEPTGCACGDILKGKITPPDCPLYRKTCSPISPVGPCMVSSEGTCSAYYRYHNHSEGLQDEIG